MSDINHYVANNLVLINKFAKNPNRLYLEDYFDILPYIDIEERSGSSLHSGGAITQLTNQYTSVKKHAKNGVITTSNFVLKINNSAEFTFNNKFINSNSKIDLSLKDTSGSIAKGTLYENNSLSLFVHDQTSGSCKIRLSSSGNESRSIAFPAQSYDINYSIDSHICNKNWCITGNNVQDTNVHYSQGVLGGGIILSTDISLSTSDTSSTILIPRINTLGQNTNITVDGSATLDANLQQFSTGQITTQTGLLTYFTIGDGVYDSNGKLLGIISKLTDTTLNFKYSGLLQNITGSTILYTAPKYNFFSPNRLFFRDNIEFECSIKTCKDVSFTSWYLGLKQTSVSVPETDSCQAYFLFDPTNSMRNDAANNKLSNASQSKYLQFVYSTASNIHYLSLLNLEIKAEHVYKFRINISNSSEGTNGADGRKATIFVDYYDDSATTEDKSISSNTSTANPKTITQYSLNNTVTGLTGDGILQTGVTPNSSVNKSLQLNGTTPVIPVLGVENRANNLAAPLNNESTMIIVYYIKCSKLLNQ